MRPPAPRPFPLSRHPGRPAWPFLFRLFGLLATGWLLNLPTPAAEETAVATVVSVEGRVELLRVGSSVWDAASPDRDLFPGDQLRTGEHSRAVLRLRNQSILPVKALSSLRLVAEPESVVVQLLRGVLSFFHRDGPGRLEVQAAGVNAAVRGTEFAMSLDDRDQVEVVLLDGEVMLTGDRGTQLALRSGEVATAAPGEAPRRTAVLTAGDWSAIQWVLEYPAILAPADLTRLGGLDARLSPVLEAYARGDLPAALEGLSADRPPTSAADRLLVAALMLSVGSIETAETQLDLAGQDPAAAALANAHRRLIDVVRRGGISPESPDPALPPAAAPASATELLAASYALQARSRLAEARDHARRAVEADPDFGVGWIRLAELEFSLGHRRNAAAALDRGLALSPAHAPGHALQGFVLAAANRVTDAQTAFERALNLDGSLATAWLGRGLCRIRRGDLAGGRADLLVAAALEPQRASLRSYLAKAYADSQPFRVWSEPDRARAELELAQRIDPGDPTPWLYAALVAQQDNRINDAVANLRESQVRNDNRALYRSQLGLEQDRAVRSANLANLFADAGFPDIGLREATRAANEDYANAAAHLFLANSYDALRDPRLINLRYETPWYSEYLLANLLAPVGAGSLSQTVAQNEYSRLFERDRAGVVNATTWTSNGDWLQRGAQYGQFGNIAYSLDATYRSENGQRPNNDLEHLQLSATAKVQVGPADGLLLQATYLDAESGDVLQRHNYDTAIRGLRILERHEPLALAGWHHEWRPGLHTLALVSPWNASQSYHNPSNRVPWVLRDATGQAVLHSVDPVPLDAYRTDLTGVSAEVQQLWQSDPQTLVAGLRYQHGGFDTTARLRVDDFDPAAPAGSSTDPDLERLSVYAYDQWQVCRAALLTAGITYDRLTLPSNFRTAPLTEGTETLDRVSPKLGVTLQPWKGGTLRAAWTHSLGGVSFDQSFRLEPVQVAGFNQAYRGLIPESIAGSVAGQRMETLGVALDQTLGRHTWFTVSGDLLTSDARRDLGGFEYSQRGFSGTTTFREDLAFTERALNVSVGHLVGRDLALTLRYRLAEAELDSDFPGLPSDAGFDQHQRSVLHQLFLGARYYLPVGFFAAWESAWTRQANHGDAASLDGDTFWQHNVRVGWRFWQRRAELAVAVLNLTDEDYALHPLNDYLETYRDRTVALSGRFAF